MCLMGGMPSIHWCGAKTASGKPIPSVIVGAASTSSRYCQTMISVHAEKGKTMADMMKFPKTWEEYERFFGFTDHEGVYTNGARLIPSFRVKQWLDHITAHAVPVVRCKDCKWFNRFGCAVEIVDFTDRPTENDYCSFGERKDDED